MAEPGDLRSTNPRNDFFNRYVIMNRPSESILHTNNRLSIFYILIKSIKLFNQNVDSIDGFEIEANKNLSQNTIPINETSFSNAFEIKSVILLTSVR